MMETRSLPWPAATQRLRIADLQIDLRYRQLLRGDDDAIELPQRAFDLLLLFLAEPHVLHTRAALFERVWQDVVVEDANLSQTVWLLRKALGPQDKAWIRTVAKSGYVFEPPCAPAVVEQVPTPTTDVTTFPATYAPDPAASDPAGLSPAGDSVPAARAAMATSRTRWRWLPMRAALVLAALVLAVAAAVLWLHWLPQETASTTAQASAKHASATHAPAIVALVDVGDPAAGDDARWPGRLLHAWLAWKLSSLPEVTLLTEADLSSKSLKGTPEIVLISSGQVPGQPGQTYIRGRISRTGKQIQLAGTQAQIPQLVDRLSARILTQLLPARSTTQWPKLTLDTATARRFTDAYDDFQRREWAAGVETGKEVIAQAPHFGLMRLQMAHALSSIGQSAPAMVQMTAARKALQPLPPEAAAVLAAEQLRLDPERNTEATQAYARLTQQFPDKPGFALQYAALLARGGDLEQARKILTRPGWEQQRISIQIERLLALARIQGNLGDRQAARAGAQRAYAMAKAAGDGWTLQRGSALLMLAQIDTMQYRERADATLYERAAKAFEAGGDEIDALLARVMGETSHPTPESNRHLDKMLAKARAGGYRTIEIELVLRAAMQQYAAGHQAAYREQLQQAQAIASESGNTRTSNMIDMHLLNDDLLRGDLASAQQRIARLKDARLQGTRAIGIDLAEASLHSARGHYAKALATLTRSTQAASERGTPVSAPIAASIGCMRGELLLQQGDLPAAHAAWSECGSVPDSDSRWQALVGGANSDLAAGDADTALSALHAALAQLQETPKGTSHWIRSLTLAALLTRAGDSKTAAELDTSVLQPLREAGYDYLVAAAQTGLAEVAVMRGQWKQSLQLATDARKLMPADAWTLDYRLREVEIVNAMVQGKRAEASQLLAQLESMARELGDTQAQMEAHSLMAPTAVFGDCTPATRNALAAHTGLRGATLDWLTVSMPAEAKAPLTDDSDEAISASP